MHLTLEKLKQDYPDLEPCIADIEAAYTLLRDTYRGGGKVLICGNGGSAADSGHIVGELMKGFESKRPITEKMRQKLLQIDLKTGTYLADHLQGALPTISLSEHTALIAAIGNDVAADMIFAQQVFGMGQAGDVLIGISTSGNSSNVLYAFRVAQALEIYTIGLTGEPGGDMRGVCDVTICVPYQHTAIVQERHLPVYHALCRMLEQEFFG
jgi:phosphoheptose isomerase